MLSRGHGRINVELKRRFNREMTFIDYTDFLANMLEDDFDVVVARGVVVNPIKRGRKSRKIQLGVNRGFDGFKI